MEQQVHFFNDHGEKLAGTLHLPDEPTVYGVVFGHCFTCSRNTSILRHICHQLVEENFMALRFDFSGNGQSEGNFAESTYSKQISEMQTAAAFASGKGASWIGLAGHSMGAVIAVITGAQMNSAKAVCALAGRFSGLSSTHFLSKNQHKELKETGRVLFISRGRSLVLTERLFTDGNRYNLPEIVASFHSPLLIVHGDRDEIVPVKEAYKASELNSADARLAIIPGADHMFSRPEHYRQVSTLVVEWFKEQRRKH